MMDTLHKVSLSTASMGKFDAREKDEPAPKTVRQRKVGACASDLGCSHCVGWSSKPEARAWGVIEGAQQNACQGREKPGTYKGCPISNISLSTSNLLLTFSCNWSGYPNQFSVVSSYSLLVFYFSLLLQAVNKRVATEQKQEAEKRRNSKKRKK